MARIRSIKPEFWTSEQVMECSTNARLLFIGLWNFCDDAGRHPWTPKQLKALVFPADAFSVDDIQRMLDELSASGLIIPYTVENKQYFYITGWRHQKIDRPQKPKYPEPIVDNSSNGIDGIQRGSGIGDKGEDSSEANASGAPAPIDFEKLAFERGKQVLGESAGGVVARLKRDKCKTWPATVAMIEEAATKQSPMEWVQGVLRKADPDEAIYRNVL